jgi:hypothetical protein
MQPIEKSQTEARHAALFGSSHDKAEQICSTVLAWNGRNFAHAPLIMPSLDQRFVALAKAPNLKSLSRDDFFDALAHHISAFHVILPLCISQSQNPRIGALALPDLCDMIINFHDAGREILPRMKG